MHIPSSMSVVLASELNCYVSKEGRCGNLVRVLRPGFICGIDVNIVAGDGASQTEGQLLDRGKEGVGEREGKCT